MDANPLKMGTGGFQIGAVQCGHDAEAAAMAAEIRHAIDDETRRAAVGSIRKADMGTPVGPMPRHVARRLGIESADQEAPTAPTPIVEEMPSCSYRPT